MNKFNLTWKNKGEWQSGDPVWNAEMGQEITDTIDEIIDNITNKYEISVNETPIGKWYDGKTIYRKVYIGNLASPDISGSNWITLDTNIKKVISSNGNIAGRDLFYVLILRNNTWTPAFDMTVLDGGKLSYRNLGISENTPYEIILEYTKIID